VKRIVIGLSLVLCFAGARAQKPSGAKELFFDPQHDTVADAARPGGRKKAPPAPRLDGDRRIAVVSTDAATQRTLGLSYWIELVDAPERTGSMVTDMRTFRSGDRIRLHFRGNADGRILLVQLGSSGTSNILFPDPDKGMTDNTIRVNEDRVLPSEKYWFRFDDQAGTEKLLVLFAKDQTELQRAFPTQPNMDTQQTARLISLTNQAWGSKDLLLETETRQASEVGTYAVNTAGKPVVLQIVLKHRM
jgi:hypothetical protein